MKFPTARTVHIKYITIAYARFSDVICRVIHVGTLSYIEFSGISQKGNARRHSHSPNDFNTDKSRQRSLSLKNSHV